MHTTQEEFSITDDAVRQAIQAFSGRISHDFNNLLTPLLAYPDMIAPDLPPDGNALNLLKSLKVAAEGAAAMASRLGDFSGALHASPRVFDAGVALTRVLAGFRGLPAGVCIEQTPWPEGLNVEMSPDAFSQVIEELLRNSLEAVRAGGGTIRVRMQRLQQKAPMETLTGAAPSGNYVEIKIEDDGPGISAALHTRVLEPFVAGFGGGRRCGGGLGLSMVYNNLRSHHAFFLLETREGAGTQASVLIPEIGGSEVRADAERETAEAGVQPTPSPGVVAPPKRQVLVVDDEPSIVNLFKLILENYIQGIGVDKAANGEEAVRMFRAARHPVIVMDLHMPVMDGQTAFLEIERLCRQHAWPMPGVVFCTGYAPREIVQKAVAENTRHTLLNKPVRSEILVKAVQARLEAIPQ